MTLNGQTQVSTSSSLQIKAARLCIRTVSLHSYNWLQKKYRIAQNQFRSAFEDRLRRLVLKLKMIDH